MSDSNVILEILKEATKRFGEKPRLSHLVHTGEDYHSLQLIAVHNDSQAEVLEYFTEKLLQYLKLPSEVILDAQEEAEEAPQRPSADQYVRQTENP